MKNVSNTALGWLIVIVIIVVLVMNSPDFLHGLATFMHGVYHP